jgi:hypothetical protein
MNNLKTCLTSLLWTGLTVMGIRGSEEPSYRILSEDGNIQTRIYQPMLIAETAIESDYNQAGKIGFNRLTRYIFGGNVHNKEMAMTTPVFRESIGQLEAKIETTQAAPNTRKWLMSFVMPPSFDLKTLPEPSDTHVIIESIPAKKCGGLEICGQPKSRTYDRI